MSKAYGLPRRLASALSSDEDRRFKAIVID